MFYYGGVDLGVNFIVDLWGSILFSSDCYW